MALFATEIKRAFCSRYCLAGFLICIFGLFFSGGSDLISQIQNPIEYDAWNLYYSIAVDGNSNWFFYVGATIPFAASYIQDRKSGYIRFVLARTSLLRFSIARFLGCAIAGGAVVAASTLLFWILCLLACPLIYPSDGISLDDLFGLGPYMRLLGEGNLIGYAILYYGAQFLHGAFWATLALSFSAFSSHVYIAYVVPLLGGLLCIQAHVLTDLPTAFNPDYISTYLSFESVSFTAAWMIVSYSIFIIVLYCVFLAILKRRWSND